MLPNVPAGEQNNDKANRRYSLFQRPANTPSSGNILFRNPLTSGIDSREARYMARRQTFDATNSICQNCKRYEVDLTNTSDNLTATDAELQASRQVISLLQRQLELLRVEKDGLEKLIIAQPQNNRIEEESSTTGVGSNYDIDSSSRGDCSLVGPQEDNQRKLLELIRTEVYSKDEEIVKLNFTLKETKNDKEQLILQLHQLEEDNTKLKSEISILKENLKLRDQTIVSLSHEVFEQGPPNGFDDRRRQSVSDGSTNQISISKAQRQIAKLVDTLDAYKKTNELLSNNVATLTSRCSDMERKEIESRSQCQELEAKCCQIQSKLLSLLKEIEQSSRHDNNSNEGREKGDSQTDEVIRSESVKLLIKRLLEDKSLDIPLSWKEGNKSKRDESKFTSSKYECDELGFYIVVDEEKEKLSPTSSGAIRNQQLSRLSGNLSTVDETAEDDERRKAKLMQQLSIDGAKTSESSWHLRWDNFIKDFDKVDLNKSREFKSLLRSGVPQGYRCKVWKALVNLKMGKERQNYGNDYYQSLIEPNKPVGISKKPALNPSSKQIELDLLRTLPNNKHFETLDSSGTVRLRRVLMAYSEHNPKVGYCQGMNRLAAVALLVLPEEEAFWCLVTIVDHIMPFGYYNDLWLAQVDSAVVMEFVAIKMPQLSEHFRKNSIELSLFAWFLTIFVDGSPPTIFLRLWDCFLLEGDKILFRIALALLKVNESEILKLSSSVAINNFLRSSISAPMDVDHLFDVAFDCINPLSTRSLRTKRQSQFRSMRVGFEIVSDTFERTNSITSDDDIGEDSSIISI